MYQKLIEWGATVFLLLSKVLFFCYGNSIIPWSCMVIGDATALLFFYNKKQKILILSQWGVLLLDIFATIRVGLHLPMDQLYFYDWAVIIVAMLLLGLSVVRMIKTARHWWWEAVVMVLVYLALSLLTYGISLGWIFFGIVHMVLFVKERQRKAPVFAWGQLISAVFAGLNFMYS